MPKIRKAASAQPVKNTGGRRGTPPPSAPTLADGMANAMSGPSLVFNIVDVEYKRTNRGKVGCRVTTLDGTTITWWSSYADGSTWADLIEDQGDGTARVKSGVRLTADNGLLPASAPEPGGFWGE